MGLTVWDIAVLAVYFLVVMGLGVWASLRVRSLGDYVMPRHFGKLMMIAFNLGSGTHSDQAVAVASKSYTNGLSGIWYQWMYLFGTPFYWWTSALMRRFRALTTGDVFHLRYDQSMVVLYSVVGLAYYAVNIGLMLKGSAEVIDASTGSIVSAEWAIVAMTVAFVVYGMAGGLAGAILTDFIQGVLTIAFSFMLLPIVLHAIGGVSGMREQLPQIVPDKDMLTLVAPDEIGVFYITMLALNGLVAVVAQPSSMSSAACRTEFDAQVGQIGGAFLKRLCTVPWSLTGLAGVVYFAHRESINPDQVFGLVAYEFLPTMLPGLLGLFIASLLASVMSTCDVFMVSAAGLFTENCYKPAFKTRSRRHYLWVARVTSLLVVTCGVVIAYTLPTVIAGLQLFWKITPMMGVAFWMGLLWRRATVAGAWASTLAGFGVMTLLEFDPVVHWIATWPISASLGLVVDSPSRGLVFSLPWQMLAYLTAAFATGIAVSLVTRPVRADKLDLYYALVRTPVRRDEPPVEEPCTLPPQVQPAPRRQLVTAFGLEIPYPSFNMMAGFIACWIIVGLMIGGLVVFMRL